MTDLPLHGKVAIVTGARRARGIGRATAVRLAADGATVVATDLVTDDDAARELETTAARCRDLGVPARAWAMDVTDPSQVEQRVAEAIAEFGRIDVLFNNAGTPVGVGPFLEIDEAAWELSWRVNVMGMVHTISAVVPHMRAAGGGSIVNNASLAGLGATKDFAAYTTTKFAVVGLTKSAAVDFGNDGIRVNAVCPGIVRTDMGEEEIDFLADQLGVTPEEADRILAQDTALGRWAEPGEVADVVAWLAGPGSGYVTGVALPVAGGMSAGL